MLRYRAVFFDFDGTLVNSGPGIILTLQTLIEDLHLRPLNDEQINSLIGPPIHVAFPEMFGIRDEEELEKVVAAYRRIFEEVALPQLTAFPGIPELLRDLAEAGVITAVASCKTQSVCDSQAELTGIRPYLRIICGARPERQLFEKADILQEALALSGAGKEESIMVGDRMFDLIGAHAVGLPVIGVTYGSGTEEELRAHAPQAIAHSVEELRALVL